MEREGIRDRIEALRAAFELKSRTRRDQQFQNLSSFPLSISLEYGQKRVRMIREESSSRSVCAFVDLASGDILYPASWKAPAKHARGSVFADDFGLSCFGDYAVKTLR